MARAQATVSVEHGAVTPLADFSPSPPPPSGVHFCYHRRSRELPGEQMAGASRLLSLALPGPQLLAWAQERAHCCHLSRPLSRHDLQPAWIRPLQTLWSECSKITHTCAGEARRAWVSLLGRGQRHVGFPCGPSTQHSGWHSGGGGTPVVQRAREQRWKGLS